MATKGKQDNMETYNSLRMCPPEAKKTIAAGRLKGFTDINPQYRIMAMTNVFGPCGVGWYYTIDKQWMEQHGQEVKCFTNVSLYIKDGDKWSAPIQGTGGSTLVEVNSRGSYVSDEGYKMSLTDALSVAMKALGVAADVYFEKGARFGTKYETAQIQPQTPAPPKAAPTPQKASPAQIDANVMAEIAAAPSRETLKEIIAKHADLNSIPAFQTAVNKRWGEIR